MSRGLELEPVPIDSAEACALMAELWRELDQLYGNEDPSGSNLTDMTGKGAAFVVARLAGKPIGCAALRPLTSSVAEVKRMFVQPQVRGRGIARALMRDLEERARAADFSEIWLESGLRQPAALRLYESLGYTRIAAFGDYKDDVLSVSYGKQLR